MPEAALRLASGLGLEAEPLAALRELGENLNYNAYGDSEADLLVPPADLYRSVSRFADPFRLLEAEPLLRAAGAGAPGGPGAGAGARAAPRLAARGRIRAARRAVGATRQRHLRQPLGGRATRRARTPC